MDGSGEVKITASELLEPARSPPELDGSAEVRLSAYDWIMRCANYQRRVLFYSPVPQSSFSQRVDLLKKSLAEVLVSFYPFAARLKVGADCFTIDCSKLSVQFSEAVTEARISELQELDFPPSKICDDLCQAPDWPWNHDSPLLFVQVTRFADDGMSVGIVFSHQVSDGVSAWHFLNSWSQVAKTGKLLNPPVTTYGFRGIDLSPEETIEKAASIGFKAKHNPEAAAKLLPASKLSTKLFHVNKETIAKLKSIAADECPGTNFSTYEVLCAYFWKQITIARNLPKDQEVKLFLLFNCRERFGGLSKYYFGNAISMAIVSSKAGELVTGGLGYAASLLHQMIVSFDERKNQAHINFTSAIVDKGYITQMDVDPAGFSLVVSSPRHPVFECDFGFGKPIGVTFGLNDLHEGKIYLFPSARDAGGVDVSVALQPPDLGKVTLQV